MEDKYDIISAWLAREIIPHEAAVRTWLSRRWRTVVDVDDVIQEAYARLSGLASVDHITSPPAYFFRTAHTVVTDQMRRAGIINFTSATQIDWSTVIDNEPLADRTMEASQELDRVNILLSQLPETHRRAIELRRIEGLSRKDAAAQLGITEDALKKQVERGMHQVIRAMLQHDAQVGAAIADTDVGTRGKSEKGERSA